jgi:hypothetical protein
MTQLTFEGFDLKFMILLIFMAILCWKIPFSNSKSDFKMGLNLLKTIVEKELFTAFWPT